MVLTRGLRGRDDMGSRPFVWPSGTGSKAIPVLVCGHGQGNERPSCAAHVAGAGRRVRTVLLTRGHGEPHECGCRSSREAMSLLMRGHVAPHERPCRSSRDMIAVLTRRDRGPNAWPSSS
jgi:hypothetical protein